MKQPPRHKTIKVWYETYHALKRMAAEKPESLAALLARLVSDEQTRQEEVRSPVRREEPEGDEKRGKVEKRAGE